MSNQAQQVPEPEPALAPVYRHLHDPVLHPHFGSVTLSFLMAGGTIHVGCAVCSPKDQFSRAKGRELADSLGGTAELWSAPVMLQELGFITLTELVFYSIRAEIDSAPPEIKGRWRKALRVIAAYKGLDDHGKGERFH